MAESGFEPQQSDSRTYTLVCLKLKSEITGKINNLEFIVKGKKLTTTSLKKRRN